MSLFFNQIGVIYVLTYSGKPEVLERFSRNVSFDPLDIFTPENRNSVREVAIQNLLDGRHEEPVFEYNQPLLRNMAERRIQILQDGEYLLGHIHSSPSHRAESKLDDFLYNLFTTRLRNALDLTSIARAIARGDDETSGRLVINLYGVPVEQSISAAEAALAKLFQPKNKAPAASEQTKFQDQEIAAVFNKAIRIYGFEDWSSEVSTKVSAIDVRNADRRLYVPVGRTVDELTLRLRTGHEVECHMDGSVRLESMFSPFFGPENPLRILIPWLIKSPVEDLYEGVAKLNDVHVKERLTGDGSSQRPIPWYVLGAHYALSHHASFSETMYWFHDQYRAIGQSPEKAARSAWDKTYRLYRGVTSPAKREFVYTKDIGYLEGFIELEHLREENPELFQLAQLFSSLSFEELNSLHHAWLDATAIPDAPAWIQSLLQPTWKKLDLALDPSLLSV